MSAARGSGGDRSLVVAAIVTMAAAAVQSVLLSRFLVAGIRALNTLARTAESGGNAAQSVASTPTVTPVHAVPPQDPHSPPTGPIRTVHAVPPQDPHSPPTGPSTRPHIP
jgi:type II secretory pathway pseudopilin PulG